MIYYINDVTIANEEVLVEYGANGTATGTYEYGNERLSVEYANHAKEYYLYNGTGNVTQTTAQNGSLYLRYTYDPFGNITSIRAPFAVDTDDINRYTYNGEDYDYTTGLQYLRARYYNTSTGSFISQDTYLGQIISPLSQNRYTYCHNNPVMYDDPSGHFLHILAGAAVGAVVGFASSAIVDYMFTGQVDWAKAGVAAATGGASGALMSIGLPSTTVSLINAGIDMVGNYVEQNIDISRGEREKVCVGEILLDGVISFASTRISYKPNLPNDLRAPYKQFGKRAFGNKGTAFDKVTKGLDSLRSGELKKAWKYMTKSTTKNSKKLALSMIGFRNVTNEFLGGLKNQLFDTGVVDKFKDADRNHHAKQCTK